MFRIFVGFANFRMARDSGALAQHSATLRFRAASATVLRASGRSGHRKANAIGSKDPYALKIPARKAGGLLPGNASLHFTLNQDTYRSLHLKNLTTESHQKPSKPLLSRLTSAQNSCCG